MKKIILFLSFILSASIVFAQYPITQYLGSDSALVKARSALSTGAGLINGFYKDTTYANLTRISQYPHAQIIVGDVLYIRDSTATRWISSHNGGSGTDSLAYRSITQPVDSSRAIFHSLAGIPDTILVAGNPQVNSDWNATSGLAQILNKPLVSSAIVNGIIDPLVVTWSGAGLIYDISAGSFIYKNVTHYVLKNQVTLTAADPTNPRIDAFYVDTLGNEGVITGIAAVNPVSPQVSTGQFLLTTAYVPAGATTPTSSIETIYDENIGSPEWTPSSTGTGTINYSNTVNPYHLTKAILESNVSAGFTKIFTKPSGVDTAGIGDVLKMFLYVANPLPTGFTFQFFNGSAASSYPLTINAVGFGYNPNTLNSYQNISIPFSAFTFTSPQYNVLKITAIGANSNPVYWDYIQIQRGLYQFVPTDYSNKVDSVTANNNNLYYWVKGSQHFINTISGSNSNIGTGYRLGVPNTNNVKTLNPLFGILMDSTSLSNTISFKADTVNSLTSKLRGDSLMNAISGKQNSLTLTTTGTSGAATLIGATLNIPQYSGGSGITLTQNGYGAVSLVGSTLNIPAKQDTLNWYSPEAYGAVGDGITNDAAAFTAMIAAMPARGGKVHLMSKTYLINTSIVINKSITIIGNGMGDSTLTVGSTKIITTSPTINIFDIQEDHCHFSDFSIINRSSSTPTGGAAFSFTINARTSGFIWGMNMNNIQIVGFYDNILATNLCEFGITNSYFRAPVRYCIYIACNSLPDAGDSYITSCEFIPRTGNSTSAIYQESSGGLRISNCKFNGASGVAFNTSYSASINVSTSDLLISGCSFENYIQNAINISSTSIFHNISITGNQFNGLISVGNDIKLQNLANISISGNNFYKSSNDTAIFLNSVNYTHLSNVYYLYTTPVVKVNSYNGVDIGNGYISYDGTDNSKRNSLSITSGSSGYLASSYGNLFPVAGLANTAGFGPGTATTSGIVIFSNNASQSASSGYISLRGGGYDTAAEKIYIDKNGVGFGTRFPTALLNLKSGTSLAGTAPLKYTAGVLLTTPESGANETDATNNKYYTNSSGVRAREGMWAYKSVTTTYTATDGDYTIDCTGGGTFTVTLPASIAGRLYTITNSGTGTITIATTSSQTFTNVSGTPTSLTIVSYGTYQVQGTGSAFVIISKL